MEQLRQYSEKFLQITPREQYLVTLSGLVVIILVSFNLFIEPNLTAIERHNTVISENEGAVSANQQSILLFEEALAKDPNQDVNAKISQLESHLSEVDKELLALTSELIDPVQMRFALLDLLNLQKGVSLVSFKISPAQPLLVNIDTVNETEDDNKQEQASAQKMSTDGLYKHSITIKLSGKYFQLRDYLASLEQLSWTFFWQDFDYKLQEYPVSELEVTLYSLSTKKEFIGV